MQRIVFTALLVACSSPATSVEKSPRAENQNVTPRSSLPAAIQPFVPSHGIYAAGGGLTSSSWRVIVDSDANTITGGATPKSGASSIGAQANEAAKPLAAATKTQLLQIANAAWAEPAGEQTAVTADYDEILIVADGDDTFFLEGFGPIRRPNAANAIAALRSAAGL